MKKHLLICSALMAAGMAYAVQPTVFEGDYITCVSPNGVWAVGSPESYCLKIRNLETGQEWDYQTDEVSSLYYAGNGHSVSNNGIVVGSTDNYMAEYWENGEWHPLSVPFPRLTNLSNSISPDGKYIVGGIANEEMSLEHTRAMMVPAMWVRQDDGTYSEPILLPCPELDFTGRVPQYISAMQVSDDGKTVIGEVQDWAGGIVEPIVYTCGADGTWSYKMIAPELANPNGLVFPEWPGDDGPVQPSYEEYMTDDEIAAYNQAVLDYYEQQSSIIAPDYTDFMSDEMRDAYYKALEEFYETWEVYPDPVDYMTEEELAAYFAAEQEYYDRINSLIYPEYGDYMTEEAKAKYDAANAKYEEEYNEWWVKFDAFQSVYQSCVEQGYPLLWNNAFLTADSKKFVSTASKEVPNDDPFSWFPFITTYMPISIDIETGEYEVFATAQSMVVGDVSADNSILASTYSDFDLTPRRAYIFPQMSKEAMPLEDFVAKTSPETATWMIENMTHDVPVDYDFDLDDYIYKECMCSGIPKASADLSVIITSIENSWDIFPLVNYYSYMFSGKESGVKTVSNDTLGLKVLATGDLVLTGEFASVSVYNVAGTMVFNAVRPAGTVAAGLKPGFYIVKAVAADGTELLRKVAL